MADRTCGWCKKAFDAKRSDAQFCSRKCRDGWGCLQIKRGRQLVDLMLRRKAHARGEAVKGKVPSFNDIDWLVQGWHMEDREAGRLHLYGDSPLIIVEQLVGSPPLNIPGHEEITAVAEPQKSVS